MSLLALRFVFPIVPMSGSPDSFEGIQGTRAGCDSRRTAPNTAKIANEYPNILDYSNILVRATNWVGDAVMSLPALTRDSRTGFRRLGSRFWQNHRSQISIPVNHLRMKSSCITCVELEAWAASFGAGNLTARSCSKTPSRPPGSPGWRIFPTRIGYKRDGRQLLLTNAVNVPKAGRNP